MKLIALCLLVLALPAHAAQCMWYEDRVGAFGDFVRLDVTNSIGPLVRWDCYAIVDESGQRAEWGQWRRVSMECRADSWANVTLAMLGSRAETVRLNADPVAAGHASLARHTKNTDPAQIARCVAAIAEDRAAEATP